MANIGYLLVISVFLFYYLLLVLFERKLLHEPREIIEKFLAITLLYAGVSLIYFSLTGEPLFTSTVEEYSIYIFIIGFIASLWAIPTLLSEFRFFSRFNKKSKK